VAGIGQPSSLEKAASSSTDFSLALPHRVASALLPRYASVSRCSALHPPNFANPSQPSRRNTGVSNVLQMAEALAVVAVVASIVQLVDFTTRVVRRLDDFHSIAGEMPKSFRQVKTELPLLGTTLQQIKEAIDADLVADGSKSTLLPVVAGCKEQVAQLDAILARTLPEITDSWRKRGKKALVSLHHDAKVESITKILRNYIGILTFYYAAASSTLQPLTGR
jgi:hypothetical protein